MKRIISLKKIEERIVSSNVGDVFVTSDFLDLASSAAANMALIRLAEIGLVRRILFGVYERPEYNSFLGEFVAPAADKVAHALARKFGWTIVPCGDTALNMLGISTQVPTIWLYVSDGTYKEYAYDNVIIKFKRTTNKEISKVSYKTALVIQALKALGKDNVTDTIIGKVSKALTDEEKDKMFIEAKYVTTWIYDIIRKICGRK